VDSCAIEEDPAEQAEDPMAVSESTKLKGVYWPGMDIFDSATPEMRRKRNQKKDSSVVEQLELNSQEVEAMELIFTPKGSFKRQRRISNSEYDDEDEIEIKAESPQPARMRPALARMDANARRSRQLARPMFPFASHSQQEDRGRSIFDFTNSDQAPKRRRGFTVYQDDEEDEATFSQPAGMTYLTSGFTRQPSPSPAPAFASYKPLNEEFHYENKENVLPPFHQQGFGNYHNCQGTGGYAQHAYAYGLGKDQRVFQYNDHIYGGNNVYQQQLQEDDDQRTITAPPSPSTS
jgi:hypothetical protein